MADLVVDHCFDGWSGVAYLTDDTLSIRISSSLRHLVVYTLPPRPDIAIEPVSHVNDAVNRMAQTGASAEDLGVCILHAGQTFSSAMRIEVEHA